MSSASLPTKLLLRRERTSSQVCVQVGLLHNQGRMSSQVGRPRASIALGFTPSPFPLSTTTTHAARPADYLIIDTLGRDRLITTERRQSYNFLCETCGSRSLIFGALCTRYPFVWLAGAGLQKNAGRLCIWKIPFGRRRFVPAAAWAGLRSCI